MPKADIGFRQSSEWVDVRGGHLGAEAAMPAMAAAVTKCLWEMCCEHAESVGSVKSGGRCKGGHDPSGSTNISPSLT